MKRAKTPRGNGFKPPDGKWFLMSNRFLDSVPFKNLSTDAVWVFLQFLKKKCVFTREYFDNEIPPAEREKLFLTYSEVKEKMGNNRFKNAKDELIDNGFLELFEPGGLFRRKNIYILSNKWKFSDPASIKTIEGDKRKKDYARRYKSWDGKMGENESQHAKQ